MAARRINKRQFDKAWEDKTRAKIQTSQIINRLNSFINSEVQLQPAQVTAALGLLKKSLPDLQSVEHSGEVQATIVTARWLKNGK